jgi:hypothetical protein
MFPKHSSELANKKSPIGLFLFAPPAGFEPAANRLTVDCSTAELQGNGVFRGQGVTEARPETKEYRESIAKRRHLATEF